MGIGLIGASEAESFVFFQNGSYFQEEIGLEEGLVSAVVGPGADRAGVVTVSEPIGDLLDGGLFEVVGERVWPAPGVVPGRS